jgi:predicted MPP superfamily phosphohydrolase
MKIAVLSDIHSNVFALDAVIKDLKKYSIDLKANLGDILYGPVAPKSTFDLLMEHDFMFMSSIHYWIYRQNSYCRLNKRPKANTV